LLKKAGGKSEKGSKVSHKMTRYQGEYALIYGNLQNLHAFLLTVAFDD